MIEPTVLHHPGATGVFEAAMSGVGVLLAFVVGIRLVAASRRGRRGEAEQPDDAPEP